jgi:hypothetical protein
MAFSFVFRTRKGAETAFSKPEWCLGCLKKIRKTMRSSGQSEWIPLLDAGLHTKKASCMHKKKAGMRQSWRPTKTLGIFGWDGLGRWVNLIALNGSFGDWCWLVGENGWIR